jgi:hypothetical protein
MPIRTGIGALVICACCAGLAACTAAASSGPDVTVTVPSVGRPAPPGSVQAALSRMAFTPYAALGQSDNDGLAPSESTNAFSEACMSAAGYPDTAVGPFSVRVGDAGLAFSQNWGSWGYLGLADAEQWGFLQPAGTALSSLGIDSSAAATNPASLPAAEQTAMLKCSSLVGDFTNTVDDGPLAGIQALTSDIYNDLVANGQVKSATRAWSACMTKNGYSYPDPMTGFRDELQTIEGGSVAGGGVKINVGGTSLTHAQNQSQIAMAVTDANCTQSSDLAGIYFAVEASYEQQIVNANQQALSAAVQSFRSDYHKEVAELPQLLKAAKAVPFKLPPRQGTSPSSRTPT